MWKVLQALFWTTVVCVFLLITPLIGVILTIGTIFYVVYEAVKEHNSK
jgi:hypothetical protein|tara:strand:+ start:52 stop:195 length:144 start_codon:yes stop_codon:yes gene_type:complete